MGVRSTNSLQSFIDDFYRSGTDALGSGGGTPVSATGGTKFTSGDYTYHFYTSNSAAPFTLSSGTSINFLLIGGGDGGQNDGGGGGGAGGVAWGQDFPVTPGEFTIRVSHGTTWNTPNPHPTSFNPGPSVIPSGSTTIEGKYGGGGRDSTTGEGGGSGGGGGQPNNAGGPATQPSQNSDHPTVTNYGNPGGQGGPGDQGGGGGGAGGAGGNGPGGEGGNGQPFTDFPGPQLYTDMPSPLQSTLGTAWRDALGSTGLMAGGGGGGSSSPAAGGPGGGGTGGNTRGNGVNYTGSGGAGGPSSPNESGGTGGHGIAVIYYPT